MTPKTQSVCEHCALKIAFYADRWRALTGSPFCDHQGKVEHEPASTGEPAPTERFFRGDGVEEKVTYQPVTFTAARPSEPAAPECPICGKEECMKDLPDTTPAAPQASAEPHSKLCYYKPHTIECRRLGDFKLVDSDTGEEFYVCSQHIQGYRDYNERCGRVVFVIVLYKRAPQPVSEDAPEPCPTCESENPDYKNNLQCTDPWHKQAGDAPKVEPICSCNPKPFNGQHWTGCPEGKVEEIARLFMLSDAWDAALTFEQEIAALADFLRPYFPPASQTLELKALARKFGNDFCMPNTHEIEDWFRANFATPASTARTDAMGEILARHITEGDSCVCEPGSPCKFHGVPQAEPPKEEKQ